MRVDGDAVNAALNDWSPKHRLVAAELARHDFYFFTRWMFLQRRNYTWLRGPHHKLICDTLMRVYEGEITRLVINIAPRYSKTELAIVNFIAWTLGRAPDSEFIHTSYSDTLATMNAFGARELVQHPAYQEIFPRVRIRSDSAAKDHWRTTEGGVVYATGAKGTITGFGAGKMREGFGGFIGIDDPHKPDEARSDLVRKGVIERFQNTLESRKNSPHTPIVVIMQRLHEEDLAGWLLGTKPLQEGLTLREPGGNGEAWHHLCIDTIRPDGTALWPAKHDIDTLLRMQIAAPMTFAGQYRQRPSTAEGNVFKPDQLVIVDAIPHGTEFIRAWDFAASVPVAGSDPDWTVGLSLGKCPDGRFIIADVVRFQGRPDDVDKALKNTAMRDGTKVRQHIPQDPGQAGKSQVVAQTKTLSGFMVMSDPVSGDKVTRAEPFASQMNVGNVMMLRAEWNAPLISEYRVFPNGKHDDQVDAGADAFNAHNMGNTGMLEFMKAAAERSKALEAADLANEAPAGSAMAILNAIKKQALEAPPK